MVVECLLCKNRVLKIVNHLRDVHLLEDPTIEEMERLNGENLSKDFKERIIDRLRWESQNRDFKKEHLRERNEKYREKWLNSSTPEGCARSTKCFVCGCEFNTSIEQRKHFIKFHRKTNTGFFTIVEFIEHYNEWMNENA